MKISITTAKTGCVEFRIWGSGTAAIDWGDGQIREKIKLPMPKHHHLNPVHISHYYTEQVTRNITISGTNIIHFVCCTENEATHLKAGENRTLKVLDCRGNKLKRLDVSNSNVLTCLDCSDNELTGESLNFLFGTLHGNEPAEGIKIIVTSGNPGAENCDEKIAMVREWNFCCR